MDFIMPIVRNAALALLLSSASVLSASAQTPLPEAVAAPGESVVLTLHAEGAQIYECKAAADGKLAWAFREPTAALLLDGKTVGRHYTGPNWEHIDSSAVVGKAIAGRREEIMTVIERIRDELALPVLYVSHDRAEVDRLASQVIAIGG